MEVKSDVGGGDGGEDDGSGDDGGGDDGGGATEVETMEDAVEE